MLQSLCIIDHRHYLGCFLWSRSLHCTALYCTEHHHHHWSSLYLSSYLGLLLLILVAALLIFSPWKAALCLYWISALYCWYFLTNSCFAVFYAWSPAVLFWMFTRVLWKCIIYLWSYGSVICEFEYVCTMLRSYGSVLWTCIIYADQLYQSLPSTNQ